MAHVCRLNLLYLEDGQELMLAEFEESVAFAAVEFFQIKNILIERDRLFNVVDFDRDVVASVNFNASPARTAHFLNSSNDLMRSALRPRISFRCTAASSSISFSPLAVS